MGPLLGGQVRLMLHYLPGLAHMGHEVLFLEDSSNWSLPFNFFIGAYTVDSEYGCDQIEQCKMRIDAPTPSPIAKDSFMR